MVPHLRTESTTLTSNITPQPGRPAPAGTGRTGARRASRRALAARWAPVAAVYAAILAASSIPGSALSGTPGWASVAGHFLEYALLAATVRAAAGGRGHGVHAVAVALVLGALNEVQQGAIPGRFPDVADLAVDGLGALAAVALAAVRDRPRAWLS